MIAVTHVPTHRWLLLSKDWWLIVAIIAWIAATTRWLPWSEIVQSTGDVQSYLPVAEAAPGLPAWPIGSVYAHRFPVHYLIGCVAAAAHVDLQLVYRIALVVVVLALAFTLRALLICLDVGGVAQALALGVVLLNPYAMRHYFANPVMLADLVFVLGTAVTLLGVLQRRSWVLLAGALIASLSRQTSLLSVPPCALWVFLDCGWGLRRLTRVGLAVTIVLVPIVTHAVIRLLVRPFSTPYEPRLPRDTVLPLLLRPSGVSDELLQHAARVASPLLVATTLITVAYILTRRRGHHLTAPRKVPLICSLLIAVVIAIQPLALSPRYAGLPGNEPRLAALALCPLALVLAILVATASPRLDPQEKRRRRSRISVLAAVSMTVALLLASLNHVDTVIGPSGITGFVLEQVGCALLATVALMAFCRMAG